MVMVVAHNGWGQTSTGSVYSIFGLGDLQSRATIQTQGMGFTSIGVSSPYWVNTVNTAANTEVGGFYTHIFDLGFYYSNTNYQSQGESASLGDGGLSQLSYWFRFKNKWTGTLGISPFSKVGYDITNEGVSIAGTKNYNVNYVGSGGLNEFYFSNSYEVLPNLTLGAKLGFILGNLTHEEYATDVSTLEGFVVQDQVAVRKLNLDFSMLYNIDREKYDINIGLIYDDKTKLSGYSSTELYNSDAEILYDETESTDTYELPQKLGAGISFVNNKWLLAADVEFNNWSEVSLAEEMDLNNTLRYSAGLEFTPNRQGLNYLSTMSYRLGYYTENSYLDIDDTSFNKWGFTAGLGLPLNTTGALNISYHRKVNGTTSNDLFLETTNEISLGISIRNLWFVQSKFK